MYYIKGLVTEFREAIEKARDNNEFNMDITFGRFPHGCCDATCDLLAYFLKQYGIRTEQVWGTYRDGVPDNTRTHAWLQIENYIVDITADQFKYESVFLNYSKSVHVGTEEYVH